MKLTIKYIIIVFIGCVSGAFVNMYVLKQMMTFIPPPMGADVSTEAGLMKAIPLFEPKHFIAPFLAHALGTLFGALSVSLYKNYQRLYLIVGLIFFLSGLYMVFQVPAPTWFNLLDLTFAYFPMAWLGHRLGKTSKVRLE